ncbi:MAG: hypothetical protein MUE85_03995 [Microscillaceae bacterium]|jgi:hypothetical protein|nr:hypothetical protein [Microscillaceae bacterium]
MKIFSYNITSDSGFAPNPFWSYCTLACCKPNIRKDAVAGDWIVGIRSQTLYNKTRVAKNVNKDVKKIIYAMQVNEKITFYDYWKDLRFQTKKPKWDANNMVEKFGDNIYQSMKGDIYLLHHSAHSQYGRTICKKENGKYKYSPEKSEIKLGIGCDDDQCHDLNSEFVLISEKDNFYYFGANPIDIPSEIDNKDFIQGVKNDMHRNHLLIDDRDVINKFMDYIQSFPKGVNSPPTEWPKGNNDWQKFKLEH